MKSRRDFLMAGAAAVGTASIARVWAAKTTGTEFPFAEFDQRIARKDFREMTKDILPTPCMVVDHRHVQCQCQAHGRHCED